MRHRGFPLRLFAICFLFAWTLFTLYPQPADLVRSVYRVFNPPISAEVALHYEELFEDLERPLAIERRVKETVPYYYDWVTYGMPWYYPTAREAFAVMAGDCKTELLILASTLEAKGIPYTVRVSASHVWVEYEGRPETDIENEDVALFAAAGGGGDSERRAFELPQNIDLERSFRSFWTAFWHYMPADRRASLFFGFSVFAALMALSYVAGDRRTPRRDWAGARSAFHTPPLR